MLPKIGKAIVAGVLLFLVYMVGAIAIGLVVGIVAVVVIVAGSGAGATPKADPVTAGIIAIVVIAAILPVVVWLYARLTPLLGVLLREPIGAWASIRRAWRLSRGSGGRLSALWVALFVVTAIVQVALWAVVGAAGPASSAVGFAAILVRSAFGAALGAYFYAGCGIVYRQLAGD